MYSLRFFLLQFRQLRFRLPFIVAPTSTNYFATSRIIHSLPLSHCDARDFLQRAASTGSAPQCPRLTDFDDDYAAMDVSHCETSDSCERLQGVVSQREANGAQVPPPYRGGLWPRVRYRSPAPA